jgi:hypothetical protein
VYGGCTFSGSPKVEGYGCTINTEAELALHLVRTMANRDAAAAA